MNMITLFIDLLNKLVQIYIIVEIIAPLLGFAFGIYWTRRTFSARASLFTYFFNITFWIFAFEAVLFTISFYLAFMPPIPIPGVDPVYVFAGVLVVALVSGSILFLTGLRKAEEATHETVPVLDKELEGEDAIHVMMVGDEPQELPPDERGRMESNE